MRDVQETYPSTSKGSLKSIIRITTHVVILVLLIFVLSIFFSGCIAEKPIVTEDGIQIQSDGQAPDAMNYTLYMNKEIALVMNILEEHMANALKVKNESYPIEDEIDNAKHSLVMVQEAVDSVCQIKAPNGYEEDGADILRRMQNAQNTLEGYYQALLDNNLADIPDYTELMEGDFASLKGIFNNMSK